MIYLKLLKGVSVGTRIFRRGFILGIESSCDDSAAAVIRTENGKIVGEAVLSQQSTRMGGVVPTFAMSFHAKNLPLVVKDVMDQSGINWDQLKAIAVTNRPGLKGSLLVGTDYAKYLSVKHEVPMIPIHHMEAHALTARMIYPELKFPFLTMLLSGGHCLLAIVDDFNEFRTMGSSIDTAPGEIMDKLARALKLHTLVPELRDVSGGRALEIMAEKADPNRKMDIRIPHVLTNFRDCNFSFSGLKSNHCFPIRNLYESGTVQTDELLPNVANYCADFLHCVTRHLCQRLQRGFEYLELEAENVLQQQTDNDKVLVISGGVASNKIIRKSLAKVCEAYGYTLKCPPPKYCTDNGAMIAWNGLEKYRRNCDIISPKDVFDVEVRTRCPLGKDISKDIAARHIHCKWIKI